MELFCTPEFAARDDESYVINALNPVCPSSKKTTVTTTPHQNHQDDGPPGSHQDHQETSQRPRGDRQEATKLLQPSTGTV